MENISLLKPCLFFWHQIGAERTYHRRAAAPGASVNSFAICSEAVNHLKSYTYWPCKCNSMLKFVFSTLLYHEHIRIQPKAYPLLYML